MVRRGSSHCAGAMAQHRVASAAAARLALRIATGVAASTSAIGASRRGANAHPEDDARSIMRAQAFRPRARAARQKRAALPRADRQQWRRWTG